MLRHQEEEEGEGERCTLQSSSRMESSEEFVVEVREGEGEFRVE